jgi:hypothetical protein
MQHTSSFQFSTLTDDIIDSRRPPTAVSVLSRCAYIRRLVAFSQSEMQPYAPPLAFGHYVALPTCGDLFISPKDLFFAVRDAVGNGPRIRRGSAVS